MTENLYCNWQDRKCSPWRGTASKAHRLSFLMRLLVTHGISAVRISAYLPSVFVLVVGLVLTGWGFYQGRVYAEQAASTQFEARVATLVKILALRISSIEDAVISVGELFAATQGETEIASVDAETFQRFATPLLRSNPEIKALEWVPRVVPEDRERLEQAGKKHFPRFTLREHATKREKNQLKTLSQREAYFPIFYVAPLAGNEQVLGYDPYHDRKREYALQQAWIEERLTVSGGTTLVQDTQPQNSLLFFYPVYLDTASPRREGDPPRPLRGFAEGVVEMNTLVKEFKKNAKEVLEDEEIDVFITDLMSFDEWLYPYVNKNLHMKPPSLPRGAITLRKEVEVADRKWAVTFYSSEALFRPDYRASWLFLWLGLSLSLSVPWHLGVMTHRRRRVEGLARIRTDELTKANQKLAYLANHDELTGLLNRRGFERELHALLLECRTHPEKNRHVLCYLNLDAFQTINDKAGYRAGDALLKTVADTLHQDLSDMDLLARVGGDEFGILFQYQNLEQGREKAQEVLSILQGIDFYWEGTSLSVSAGLGLACLEERVTTIARLMNRANTACHEAKRRGRGQIEVDEDNPRELSTHRKEREWFTMIRDGLIHHRIGIRAQLIQGVSMQARREPGMYEILACLDDGEGQWLLPGQFIPPAERHGQVHDIDRAVMEALFSWLGQSRELSANPDRHLWTLNLSAASLGRHGFAEVIRQHIEASGIAPEKFILEIPESVALANQARARNFIQSVKEVGCLVALDDVGGALTSFAFLRTLPLDYVKIDGGIITQIPQDAFSREIVKAIVALCRIRDIQTIAEYVETHEIHRGLLELGVDYAQGHYIGKPMILGGSYSPSLEEGVGGPEHRSREG